MEKKLETSPPTPIRDQTHLQPPERYLRPLNTRRYLLIPGYLCTCLLYTIIHPALPIATAPGREICV